MGTENCCPVCGDATATDSECETEHETNATVSEKSPVFRAAFECFIKLFEVNNPPWLEKRVFFCHGCQEQLSLVYELKEVLEDTDSDLTESKQMLRDRFRGSEDKFQLCGVYQRDKRYWELRKEFMNKVSMADYEGSFTAGSSNNDDDVAVAPYYVPKRKETQNELTSSLDVVWKHVKETHLGSFKCTQCKEMFKSKYFVTIHEETVHKLGNTTFCPICSKPFYGKPPLRSHIWTHYSAKDRQEAIARGEKVPAATEKRYQCHKCPLRFRRNAELSTHFKRVHNEEGGEELEKKLCGVCGRFVMDLKRHIRLSHTNEEDYRFKCSVCNKKFVKYTCLKSHKLTHVEGKPFKCEFCGMEFKLEKCYKTHRNGRHLRRPLQCHLCPFSTTTNSFVLKRHIRGVHERKFPDIDVQQIQGGR